MALSTTEQEAIAARVTKLRDERCALLMRAFDNQFMYAARKQMEQLAQQAGKEFADALASRIKASMKLEQD